MHLEMSVSKIFTQRHLWYLIQNYQKFIEMTSNMIYIVAFRGGLKCPRKIPLGTVGVGGRGGAITSDLPTALLYDMI